MPTFEQVKSPEQILIEILKTYGLNSETRKYLIEYQKEQERMNEGFDGDEYKIEQIKSNLKIARIYREAELDGEIIRGTYDDLLTQIYQEFGNCEFYWEVYEELEDCKKQFDSSK